MLGGILEKKDTTLTRLTNDTKKTLVVLFDGDIVKNHSFSSSEGETMGGLVR